MNDHLTYPSIPTLSISSKRSWVSQRPQEKGNEQWYIEEKIDGSQFTFRLNPESNKEDRKVAFYCKGRAVLPTNKNFLNTINLINTIRDRLNEKYIYHGESVTKKQHNVIKYHRTPKYYFILYDIYDTENSTLLDPISKQKECERVGLEMAPILYYNGGDSSVSSPIEKCQELLDQIEKGHLQSLLGGQVEGLVLKHHQFVNEKGKTVATKFKLVTKEFQEVHGTKLNKKPETPEELLEELGKRYATRARYQKSFQHLRDQDKLKQVESDSYKIKEELDIDLEKECSSELKEYLWAELGPFIKRFARYDFDQWYKTKMLKEAKEADSNKDSES